MPPTDKRPPQRTPPPPPEGAGKREYAHSSGDRNTRTDEDDWNVFKDGKRHTEHADRKR
jgi:hypothetical protein